MFEVFLNEIRQILFEVGRSFYLSLLAWYVLSILWYLVNPKISWKYTENQFYKSIKKDVNYISSHNIFAQNLSRFIVRLYFAGLEPTYTLLRIPKTIKKNDGTLASRNTVMTVSLEKLPLSDIRKNLKLYFLSNDEWYDIDFDEVRIFVVEEPNIQQTRDFHNHLNNQVRNLSGKQLMLSYPIYQSGEINVLFMKIVKVKRHV